MEHFEPSEDELAKARALRERESGPLKLQIDASVFGVSVIEELKAILAHFPGSSEVLLVMKTRQGPRELQFGREFRVKRSAALDAELAALLGTATQAA